VQVVVELTAEIVAQLAMGDSSHLSLEFNASLQSHLRHGGYERLYGD